MFDAKKISVRTTGKTVNESDSNASENNQILVIWTENVKEKRFDHGFAGVSFDHGFAGVSIR